MKLIFEYDQQPTEHVEQIQTQLDLPSELIRNNLPLPNVNETDIVRHYTNLSKKNFKIL